MLGDEKHRNPTDSPLSSGVSPIPFTVAAAPATAGENGEYGVPPERPLVGGEPFSGVIPGQTVVGASVPLSSSNIVQALDAVRSCGLRVATGP